MSLRRIRTKLGKFFLQASRGFQTSSGISETTRNHDKPTFLVFEKHTTLAIFGPGFRFPDLPVDSEYAIQNINSFNQRENNKNTKHYTQKPVYGGGPSSEFFTRNFGMGQRGGGVEGAGGWDIKNINNSEHSLHYSLFKNM